VWFSVLSVQRHSTEFNSTRFNFLKKQARVSMGRILFLMIVAFCVFFAVRIVVKARRGNASQATEESPTEPVKPELTPAHTLTACPLCAVHMPTTELSAHLKQSHGAT
jgi:large-conductance mechanosensitive channel